METTMTNVCDVDNSMIIWLRDWISKIEIAVYWDKTVIDENDNYFATMMQRVAQVSELRSCSWLNYEYLWRSKHLSKQSVYKTRSKF